MDIIQIFGDNVKRYRKESGLSQEEFADKCNLHRTYISSIERYQKNVSLKNIQKIADALSLESYQLLIAPHDSNGNGDKA